VKYLPSGILKEHSTGLLRSKGFAFISQGQPTDRFSQRDSPTATPSELFPKESAKGMPMAPLGGTSSVIDLNFNDGSKVPKGSLL